MVVGLEGQGGARGFFWGGCNFLEESIVKFIQKKKWRKKEMLSLKTKHKKLNVVTGQSAILKYLLSIPYTKMKQCLGVLRKLDKGGFPTPPPCPYPLFRC